MFDEHAKAVLHQTIKIVFPLNVKPNQLIKKHVWRNKKYVGEANGKISTWAGWSANLNHVDFRYRAVFIDLVENNLTEAEKLQLFGSEFTHAIEGLSDFVVLFVLDFPMDTVDVIKTEGFIPRIMKRVAHACIICSVDEFESKSSAHWAASLARLILLQRVLSIHRKPFEANEVPLQNLLYRTGYFHSYIIKGGLELQSLSQPRKSGDFGHDLHAIVRNPVISAHNFALGIEVYMGPIGYHADSIPSYVNHFDLSGMIVVAKDDPFVELKKVSNKFPREIRKVELSNIGTTDFIGIHHLALERIITDFDQLRNEIDEIVPSLQTYID